MSLRRLFSRKSDPPSKRDSETEEVGVNARGDESSASSASTSITFLEGQLICAGLSLGRVPEWLSMRYGKRATTLDLSGNDLEDDDLALLSGFTCLQSLVLDHNLITEQGAFPPMRTLRTISLNKNKIESIAPFLSRLASSFPNLSYLSLIFNTACPNELVGRSQAEYRAFRIKAIAILPNLKFLDSTPVSQQELVAALEERASNESLLSAAQESNSHAGEGGADEDEGQIEYTEVARDPSDGLPAISRASSSDRVVYSSIAHATGSEYSTVQPELTEEQEWEQEGSAFATNSEQEIDSQPITAMPIYAKPNKVKRGIDFSNDAPSSEEHKPATPAPPNAHLPANPQQHEFLSEDDLFASFPAHDGKLDAESLYVTKFDVDGSPRSSGAHVYEDVETARQRPESPIYASISDQVRKRETQRLSLLLEDKTLDQYEGTPLSKVQEHADRSPQSESPKKDRSRRNSEEIPQAEWRRATADFALRAFGCYLAEALKSLRSAEFAPSAVKSTFAKWDAMSTPDKDEYFKQAHGFGMEYRMAMGSLDFTWMKPVSAYMHYGIILRAPLVRVFADVGAPALASIIHESWESMDDDDKKAFDDLAQKDFQSYCDFFGYPPDTS